MRKNAHFDCAQRKQEGIAHVILILIILLAAVAVWFFVSKPWQTKLPAPAQELVQEAQNPAKELPKTNPFEVKTNPFKDVKTNPFR